MNSEIRDDTELGKLMSDFHCTVPADMYNKVLAERVDYLKNTKEGNAIMCKIVEELVNERIYAERIENAKAMIAEGIFTVEQISKFSKLPLEEVEELIAKHSA